MLHFRLALAINISYPLYICLSFINICSYLIAECTNLSPAAALALLFISAVMFARNLFRILFDLCCKWLSFNTVREKGRARRGEKEHSHKQWARKCGRGIVTYVVNMLSHNYQRPQCGTGRGRLCSRWGRQLVCVLLCSLHLPPSPTPYWRFVWPCSCWVRYNVIDVKRATFCVCLPATPSVSVNWIIDVYVLCTNNI